MVVLAALLGGCSSFLNPAFVRMVAGDSPDTSVLGPITLANAPGHVPIMFVNNTRFDQNLIDYLEDIGIDTSDPELRPRVRVRITIQYVTGSSNTIEFLDGSDIIQGTVQTAAGTQENPLVPNALTENSLSNVVGVCDILAVQPDASVEVFVPVFLKVIQLVEISEREDVFVGRDLERTIPPQFTVLRSDDVDANNNVTLQRNFDVRDIPVQVTNVQCGSVVGFTLSGTLRVPFVQDELGQIVPGWEDTDFPSEASNPGRFEFQTAVR